MSSNNNIFDLESLPGFLQNAYESYELSYFFQSTNVYLIIVSIFMFIYATQTSSYKVYNNNKEEISIPSIMLKTFVIIISFLLLGFSSVGFQQSQSGKLERNTQENIGYVAIVLGFLFILQLLIIFKVNPETLEHVPSLLLSLLYVFIIVSIIIGFKMVNRVEERIERLNLNN